MTERTFPDNALLGDARQYLRDNWGKHPVACPCCRQKVELYRRQFHKGMVVDLRAYYEHAGLTWAHYREIPGGVSGDYAKLKWWGLLEPAGEKLDDGNSNGMWRVTPRGEAFLQGRVAVVSHIGDFNKHQYKAPNTTQLYVGDVVEGFRLDEMLRGSRA